MAPSHPLLGPAQACYKPVILSGAGSAKAVVKTSSSRWNNLPRPKESRIEATAHREHGRDLKWFRSFPNLVFGLVFRGKAAHDHAVDDPRHPR
jgi:hypothetical protein